MKTFFKMNSVEDVGVTIRKFFPWSLNRCEMT